MSANQTSIIDRAPIFLPSVVWLLAIIAALVAAGLRGYDVPALMPIATIAAIPAILGLLLFPAIRQEWAQIILMLSWAALALLACLTLGFVPMALLFITVPAIATLFVREKVVEALVIAVLIAGVVYFAGREGYLPDTTLISETGADWARRTGLAALLAFTLAALFSAATRRDAAVPLTVDAPRTYWRDGVTGGLFEYDAKARLVGMNAQASEQFSGNVPVSLLAFLPLDHTDQAALGAKIDVARQTKQPQAIRISHAASGELANYDIRITPLKTGGWLVHSHDRTNDEAEMEALRRMGASAARDSTDKTLFFAGVSHELRTPLNAIIGFSDMMRSRLFGPLPGKYAEYADLIHESGQHMLDLIGDVLDMSKVEAGRYELNYDTFDAADVIRSSVKMIRPAADAAEVAIDVNLDLDQALLIQADRRAVRQILLNLLSNAVKFSERGSRVDIDAQAIDGDLELSVSDTGMGMDAEELERIGDPYAQGTAGQLAAERGSGLGLSLVKSLTELHGGKMDIKSVLGDGTRVKIILPLQVD